MSSKNNIKSLPISKLAKIGDIDGVKRAIKSGVDIDDKDYRGHSALSCAIIKDQIEIVKILIENGADINNAEDTGHSALYCTIARDQTEMAKILIESSMDVNATDYPNRQSVLFFAVFNDRTEIVKALVARCTDVNIKDHKGFTPLYYANRDGYKEIIKILIDNGAN